MGWISLNFAGPAVDHAYQDPTSGWTLAAGARIPSCPPWELFLWCTNIGLNTNTANSAAKSCCHTCSSGDLQKTSAVEFLRHRFHISLMTRKTIRELGDLFWRLIKMTLKTPAHIHLEDRSCNRHFIHIPMASFASNAF